MKQQASERVQLALGFAFLPVFAAASVLLHCCIGSSHPLPNPMCATVGQLLIQFSAVPQTSASVPTNRTQLSSSRDIESAYLPAPSDASGIQRRITRYSVNGLRTFMSLGGIRIDDDVGLSVLNSVFRI